MSGLTIHDTPQFTVVATRFEITCKECGKVYDADSVESADSWKTAHKEAHRQYQAETVFAARKDGDGNSGASDG